MRDEHIATARPTHASERRTVATARLTHASAQLTRATARLTIVCVRWFFDRVFRTRAGVFLTVVGLGLGFTAPEIASVQDDNTCLQGIASGQIALDAFVDAVRQYQKTVTEGDIGDPAEAPRAFLRE